MKIQRKAESIRFNTIHKSISSGRKIMNSCVSRSNRNDLFRRKSKTLLVSVCITHPRLNKYWYFVCVRTDASTPSRFAVEENNWNLTTRSFRGKWTQVSGLNEQSMKSRLILGPSKRETLRICNERTTTNLYLSFGLPQHIICGLFVLSRKIRKLFASQRRPNWDSLLRFAVQVSVAKSYACVNSQHTHAST